MKVQKILNNNIAIVIRGNHESIAYSPGIAFKKKVGQTIDESEIAKSYVLDSKDRLEHLSYLLTHTDESIIELVNKIVAFGEKELAIEGNDYLYLALLDHISFAIKRGHKKQFIMSPLVWEVKKFYPKHYAVGLKAVKWLVDEFKIDFPEDEAVSITLHFINVQDGKTNINEKVKDIEILRDILNIIKYHFKTEFYENSLKYMRLVTHLQYFIERVNRNESYDTEPNLLYEQVKTIYPNAYQAVEKINAYVLKKFKQQLSKDEYTYLMIHINRVTERKES